MIRDYLNGHHLSYFPPFKMLAVLSIFIVILSMAFDAHFSDTIAEKVLEMIDDFSTYCEDRLAEDKAKAKAKTA
jgi:hypothetical protein